LRGQAAWYLQSRITQCPDYSIILDQTRDAALVVQRYSTITDSEINQRMKDQYATPIPTSAVFTTQQCREKGIRIRICWTGGITDIFDTHLHQIELSAIRKLARFMQYCGRYHFKLRRHLPRHIQCHRNKEGIKFYLNMAQSSLHHYMSRSGNETHTNSSIICSPILHSKTVQTLPV
jgi:hypothetical protein